MAVELAFCSVGVLFLGAVLGAQPPADFEASRASGDGAVDRPAARRHSEAGVVILGPVRSPSTVRGASFFTDSLSSVASGRGGLRSSSCRATGSINQAAAQKTGVDAQLVRAVIDKESAGRPCALSAKGAEGLMQLMPATAEEFDVEDPSIPSRT